MMLKHCNVARLKAGCAFISAAIISGPLAATQPAAQGAKQAAQTLTLPDANGAGQQTLIFVEGTQDYHVLPISGPPDLRLPVRIVMPLAARQEHLLLAFRSLPPGFSLSAGFGVAEAWFVSLSQTKDLHLQPPKGFTGEFILRVEFIRGQNTRPVRSIVPVTITNGPADRSGQRQLTAAIGTNRQPSLDIGKKERAQTEKVLRSVSLDPAHEKRLLGLAQSLLKQKDIAAARLVYARLARRGSATAALACGQTYDAAFLSRYDVINLKPNVKKARRWYELAAKLGNRFASERLAALNASN